MELPYAKHREQYASLVKGIEDELKSVTSSADISDMALHEIQQKLDVLDKKYQDDKKIGTALYKLYELQAFIHYFNHQDSEALDFINHAIELKGSAYQKAQKLKDAIVSKNSAPQAGVITAKPAKRSGKFNGLGGWLAFFIVGQILGLLVTVFNFFVDGFLSSSDIVSLNEYQTGLGDTVQVFTGVEDLMIALYVGLAITTLVLLFRRNKLAKTFAITTLIFVAIFGIVDYAVAYSIYDSADLMHDSGMQALFSKVAGNVGRNLVAAFIWVPYFMVSKRVKQTLTR